MNIKTWQEVSKQFTLDRRVMATNQMIWMQQEIDELRAAYEALKASHLEFVLSNRKIRNRHYARCKELRDSNEALQKELGLAKLALESKRDLLKSCEAALEQSQAENAAQAKRIIELEEKLQYRTNIAC